MLCVDTIVEEIRNFTEVKRLAEIRQPVSTTWTYVLFYSKAHALSSELEKKKRHSNLFPVGKIREKYIWSLPLTTSTHSDAIWILFVEISLSVILKVAFEMERGVCSGLLVRFHSSFILPDKIFSTVSGGARMPLRAALKRYWAAVKQLLDFTRGASMFQCQEGLFPSVLLTSHTHLGQVGAEFLPRFLLLCSITWKPETERWKKQRGRKA